ncbi:MAG: hypothetical protein Alis3KO_05560 [Aliiglaciecola sp.]
MSVYTKRYSGLLILLTSIILAVIVSAGFYYFKIQKNEQYQNQLHFREIKDISRLFDIQAEKLNNLSSNYVMSQSEKIADTALRYQISINQYLEFENSSKQLNSEKQRIESELNDLRNNRSAEQQKLRDIKDGGTSVFELELTELEEQVAKQKSSLDLKKNEAKLSYEKFVLSMNRLEEITSEILFPLSNIPDTNAQRLFKYCETSEQCTWIAIIFNEFTLQESFDDCLDKTSSPDSCTQEFDEIKDSIEKQQEDFANSLMQPVKFAGELKKFIEGIENLIANRASKDDGDPSINISIQLSTKAENLGCINKDSELGVICEEILELIRGGGEIQPLALDTLKSRLLKEIQILNLIETTMSKIISLWTKNNAELKNASIEYMRAKDLASKSVDDVEITETQLHNSEAKVQAKFEELNHKSQEISNKISVYSNAIIEKEAEFDVLSRAQDDLIDRITNYTREQTRESSQRLIGELNSTTALSENFESIEKCLIDFIRSREQCDIQEPSEPSFDIYFRNAVNSMKRDLMETSSASLERVTFRFLEDDEKNHFDSELLIKSTQGNAVQAWIQKDLRLPNSKGFLRISVPLEDAIQQDTKHHPLIMMVDNEGNLLARIENPKIDAAVNGLQFDNIKPLLNKLYKNINKEHTNQQDKFVNKIELTNIDNKESVSNSISNGISGITDIEIAGEGYRVFVSPYGGSNFQLSSENNSKKAQFYVVGLRNISQLTENKLSISRSQVALGLGFVVSLILFIPLLRLRLLSPTQGISALTFKSAIFSLILLAAVMGIITTLIRHYVDDSSLNESRTAAIFKEIKKNFNEEFQQLASIVESQRSKLFVDDDFACRRDNPELNDVLIEFTEVSETSKLALENIFLMPNESPCPGEVSKTVLYTSENQFRKNGNLDLSHREYYKRASSCRLWPIESVKKANKNECAGFFMQRLFNVQNGQKTTQFAEAYGEKSSRFGRFGVLSYGTNLRTFLNAVLPTNFGYFVFDNNTGVVQFHSDDSRSLVENIFVETDNNSVLREVSRTSFFKNEPVEFSSTYKGKEHLFSAGPLKKGIPWTLVIFHNNEQTRNIVLLKAFTAAAGVFIILLLIALLFFGLRMLSARISALIPWVYLRPQNHLSYQAAKFRYLMMVYFLIVLTPFILGIMVFERIDDPFDRAITELHALDSYKKYEDSTQLIQQYREKIYNFKLTNLPADDNEPSLYLGHMAKNVASNNNDEKTDQGSDESGQNFSKQLVEWILGRTNFKHPVNKQLFLHVKNSNQQPTSALDFAKFKNQFTESLASQENKANWSVYAWLYGVLALCLCFVLVFEWIGRRLYGVFIQSQWLPKGYRSKNTPLKTMVIRPTLEFVEKLCTGKEAVVGNKVVSIDEFTDDSVSIEDAVNYKLDELKSSNSDLEPMSEQSTRIAINGLEKIAFDRISRLRALSALECLDKVENLNIILLCEIAPLYRLTNQSEYPGDTPPGEFADVTEKIRWSKLFKGFEKQYDWCPTKKSLLYSKWQSALSTIDHEFNVWPEISVKRREFNDIYSHTKEGMSSEQVIEYCSAACGAEYRYRWELCTKTERLILIQLASGMQPNPMSHESLSHLVRRGYVYRNYGWHIVSESFRRFVMTAEKPLTVEYWFEESQKSAWSYFRIPLFAAVITMLAILAFSATDAIESALGILSTILALIPLALKNLALFKAGSSGGGE